MNIILPKAKLVIAVSGGVDSMVLLDLARRIDGAKLIVAHYNHGIRADSAKDERLVSDTAKRLGLKFEAGRGNLGPRASEATARDARYGFLEAVKQKHKADFIVTAHHQDDLIETAILNIYRGTGRRGLSSISNSKTILRPLLGVSKEQIRQYARANKLKWREDSTNLDLKHKRNYIRIKILPKLSKKERLNLVNNLEEIAKTNKVTNLEIEILSHSILKDGFVDRQSFIMLPTEVAKELAVFWLRKELKVNYQKESVDKVVNIIKTAKAGTHHDLGGNRGIRAEVDRIRFIEIKNT